MICALEYSVCINIKEAEIDVATDMYIERKERSVEGFGGEN
jgi:hypothetical protein